MSSGYPDDFNPREELKKKSEKYAQLLFYGLPNAKLSEFDPLPDGAQAKMAVEWLGRPIWELWTEGKVLSRPLALPCTESLDLSA